MQKKYAEIVVHTDGGSRGNPGPAAIGVVVEGREVVDGSMELLKQFGVAIGTTTNNVAEYTALKEAFVYLKEQSLFAKKVTCILDSLLVVQQLSGVYKLKKEHLKPLFAEITLLSHQVGERVQYLAVPRAENARADALVNAALDAL